MHLTSIVVLLFSQHANSKPTHAHTHTQRDGFWGPLPGVCLAPTARGQLRASISWGGVGGGTQTTFGRPPHVVHGGNYCTSRPCSVQRYVRMVRRRRGCGMTRRAGRSCPRCEARRDGERGRGLGVGVACKSRERKKRAASPWFLLSLTPKTGSSLFQRLSSFLAGVGVTSLVGYYFLIQDVKRYVREGGAE